MSLSEDSPIEAVLQEALEHAKRSQWTMLPARVESYDAAAQVASVSFLVRDVLPSRELPTLPRVPVLQLRASDLFVHLPVSVGDTGIVLFASLDMSRWRNTGQLSDPSDTRRNSLQSAVFLPGLVPSSRSLSGAGVDSDHIVLAREGSAADFVALAAKTDAQLAALRNAIVALVGLLTGPAVPPVGPPPSGIWVPVPLDGGTALQVAAIAALATLPATLQSVAATDVKAS